MQILSLTPSFILNFPTASTGKHVLEIFISDTGKLGLEERSTGTNVRVRTITRGPTPGSYVNILFTHPISHGAPEEDFDETVDKLSSVHLNFIIDVFLYVKIIFETVTVVIWPLVSRSSCHMEALWLQCVC